MSESETEEVEADSVIQNMKDRRKASGQEIADIKLRHVLILAWKTTVVSLKRWVFFWNPKKLSIGMKSGIILFTIYLSWSEKST